MVKRSASEEHFMNKTVESNFALWNALLTVNGIMLTAFSLAVVLIPSMANTYAVLLVASCTLSLLLLVWNFLATKQLYLGIGERLSGPVPELTDKTKRREINAAEKAHKNVQRRETAVLLLLLLEAAFIICFLIGASTGGTT